MRMCVIAQTPLISPFGSIGFRERERERGIERERERGRGSRPGTQREDKGERKIEITEMLNFIFIKWLIWMEKIQ